MNSCCCCRSYLILRVQSLIFSIHLNNSSLFIVVVPTLNNNKKKWNWRRQSEILFDATKLNSTIIWFDFDSNVLFLLLLLLCSFNALWFHAPQIHSHTDTDTTWAIQRAFFAFGRIPRRRVHSRPQCSAYNTMPHTHMCCTVHIYNEHATNTHSKCYMILQFKRSHHNIIIIIVIIAKLSLSFMPLSSLCRADFTRSTHTHSSSSSSHTRKQCAYRDWLWLLTSLEKPHDHSGPALIFFFFLLVFVDEIHIFFAALFCSRSNIYCSRLWLCELPFVHFIWFVVVGGGLVCLSEHTFQIKYNNVIGRQRQKRVSNRNKRFHAVILHINFSWIQMFFLLLFRVALSSSSTSVSNKVDSLLSSLHNFLLDWRRSFFGRFCFLYVRFWGGAFAYIQFDYIFVCTGI